MRIVLKLTIVFFLVAFVPIVIFGWLTYKKGSETLQQESFKRLTAVREVKSNQIKDYFSQLHEQAVTYSEDPTIVTAMKEFKTSFDAIGNELVTDAAQMHGIKNRVQKYYDEEYTRRLAPNLDSSETIAPNSVVENALILQDLYIASNPHDIGSKHELYDAEDASSYSKIHALYHPVIKNFQERFGYYDIFLVDTKSGHIVYSVFKEMDYGTSLKTGPYSKSNISKAFNEANAAGDPEFVEWEDYAPYHPSYNAHASFISSPIFDGDERVGVLIFQIPIDRINNIMTSRGEWKDIGLGESGETYLVGQDFTLRNQSRFLMEDHENYFKMIKEIGMPEATIQKMRTFNSSIGLQEVRTEGTMAALNGEKGTRVIDDYRGVKVLSAFSPLGFEGTEWVIMSEIDEEESLIPVLQLRNSMIFGMSVLALLIIIIGYFVAKTITRPIKKLTANARQLARGKMDVDIQVHRKDEIGVLALSFKKMQASIGNLIGELKEINQNLENKVAERTSEVTLQKEMVEEKNREIVDSINYAKRLQTAILPPRSKIKAHLEDNFVLFKPKDIVSGDFYWMEAIDDKVMLAVVDCTGHGVPGAMLSVVGANGLNRCVKEFDLRQPAAILDKLTDLIMETLDSDNSNVSDGMDISFVSIDFKNNSLEFAGAHNALWIVRNHSIELEEIKGNKQPIGRYDYRTAFTNHEVQLNKGDCIYLSSDGFADQFGGPKGKKLKSSTFKSMMVGIHDRSMERQVEILDEEFENWKGGLEQIDDVCVIGVRM